MQAFHQTPKIRIQLPRIVLSCVAIGITLGATATQAQSLSDWKTLANRMVDEEIVGAGVKDPRVIRSVRETPRHEFVPLVQRQRAYLDMALPIGEQQTISPPFVVAYMTEQLDPQPTDRVLEIGTGSGYQAAVLSPLVKEVYTIEIVEPLGRKAQRTLERMKYDNVHVRVGDGYLGWPEAAPFDKIIVTCSPEKIPQPLIDQLVEGGRMIIPLGERYQQNLHIVRKVDGKLEQEPLQATLFVPMTGTAEEQREVQPDAIRPSISNGSFEELLGDGDQPSGWHYVRQARVESDSAVAPDGERFITFTNKEPGRGCQALQGFAVDGRKVKELNLSFQVRGKDIRYGQAREQWPFVIVTFYDERRRQLDSHPVGPFFGSFEWTNRQATLPVPVHAREAIIRIGLLGAIGEFSLDDLQLEAQ
ncbi:MAG: protein-L-isoaspartate(D-aspartate) O-methyltransferase [Pirellulales bacterium]